MFNNIFKIFISTIVFLVLCISIYVAILVSLDFFDKDKKPLLNKDMQENRLGPMDPKDMMRGPMDHKDMMRGPMDHKDMMRGPMDPKDMMRGPMDPRDMIRDPNIIEKTSEEYELIIKELELQKQFIDRDITLEKNRIDLEIQRITNEKNKLK